MGHVEETCNGRIKLYYYDETILVSSILFLWHGIGIWLVSCDWDVMQIEVVEEQSRVEQMMLGRIIMREENGKQFYFVIKSRK